MLRSARRARLEARTISKRRAFPRGEARAGAMDRMTYMPKELQKVVGTRPIRPDGVDKVTGQGQFRRRHGHARDAVGQGQTQPACSRPHHVDQYREGAGTPRRQGRRYLGRLPADPVGGSLCRRRADEFPRPVAQLHGARQGALRRPRGGCGRRDLAGDRRGGLRADRGQLSRAAARHRRRRGDEARRTVIA